MIKYLQCVLVVVTIVILIGCEGEEGKRGIPAPILNGTIKGSVTTSIKQDLVGIEVKIAETSQKTVTDSLGNWAINDVKAGIYTIEVSKTGYGISKIQNYSFVGGGTSIVNSQVSITKLPQYTATQLDLIEAPTEDFGQFSCILNFTPEAPSSEPRTFRVYFSKYKNFAPTSGNFFYSEVIGGNKVGAFSELTIRFKNIVPTLKNKNSSTLMTPFVKGDSVYVTACAFVADNSGLASSGFYDNQNFHQFVYTSITAPTNTVAFKLP